MRNIITKVMALSIFHIYSLWPKCRLRVLRGEIKAEVKECVKAFSEVRGC